MKELICPNCNKAFTVDEAEYASIVNQVKNAEFRDEVDRRVAELKERNDALQKVKDADAARQIAVLKDQLAAIEEQKRLELAAALAAKEQRITTLQSAVDQNDSRMQVAIMQERQRAQEALSAKDTLISQLKAANQLEKSQSALRETSIKGEYEARLKMAQEQVDYYKDMKTRLSTKMVGETLEQHCSTQFNTLLRPVFPEAYFEKDNDTSEGTKGDFIFRDSTDGFEYISIMFEMKNEMDDTASKHKNEDFFKKLDVDRKAKGCEFAVLVSLLEPDSELYNGGIVDVSHRYPKMYVIRPQFFIPLITLLVQVSRKSVSLQKELAEARSQTIDVTNFENRLRDFQLGFTKNYECAEKYFEKVIKDLDNAISSLTKMRDDLTTTGNQLRLANNKAAEVTIKKLTRGNPTMTKLFEEARAAEVDNQ